MTIHDDLLKVLNAVQILSPTRYRVLGEIREIAAPDAIRGSAEAERSRLLKSLTSDLYGRLYVRPSQPLNPRSFDAVDQRDLMAALSAANRGRGTWDAGWLVRRIEGDGRVVVAKDGVAYWASLTDVRVDGGPPELGARCRVRIARELRRRIPGFYLAVGNEDAPQGDYCEPRPAWVRYYWHLTLAAAVPFVETATSLLNSCRVPGRLKVLTDPGAYVRADAGVLYVDARRDPELDAIIDEIYAQVGSRLRSDVPLFTQRLADGLSWAEDPLSEMSFGEHRCRLIAEALYDSLVRGDDDRDAHVVSVVAAFWREGLDPLQPHLSRSSGQYRDGVRSRRLIAIRHDRPVDPTTEIRVPGAAESRTASPLDAAVRIGAMLCDSAFWDRDRQLCNWMGRVHSEGSAAASTITRTSAALDFDLHEGSAGIALFLALLYRHTGDSRFRRTALGAMSRSIRQLESPASATRNPLSAFNARIGAAFAAGDVGVLADRNDLIAQAESMLDNLIESAYTPGLFKAASRDAGAIRALVSLAGSPGFARCLELAIALGDELCRDVEDWEDPGHRGSEVGPGPGNATEVPLRLSGGLASVCLALLALYEATYRTEYLSRGLRVFAEEDLLAEAPHVGPSYSGFHEQPSVFAWSWSSGAPLIALARLRAASLEPERAKRHRALARAAIATTLDAIDDNLAVSEYDASLGHGLSGLGEVLVIAGQWLGDSTLHDRARSLGRALIDRHGTSGDWPAGVPSGGPNPSLMFGLAGTGLWFLRLHEPHGVPPVFVLVPPPVRSDPE
jgi:HopA1 effector protein family/Lanthionine synthetase C-like protein